MYRVILFETGSLSAISDACLHGLGDLKKEFQSGSLVVVLLVYKEKHLLMTHHAQSTVLTMIEDTKVRKKGAVCLRAFMPFTGI